MINETIKNKYIVCKSPEHGKKIIEFFVANGAVNSMNHRGDAIGAKYYAREDDKIRFIVPPPIGYTEMELPEDFTPKRGDKVEVSHDGSNWFTRIFLTQIECASNPFICVSDRGEEVYLNGDEFLTCSWKFCQPIQTITKAEAEKLLGKTIEG